jgi:hypothetical protein
MTKLNDIKLGSEVLSYLCNIPSDDWKKILIAIDPKFVKLVQMPWRVAHYEYPTAYDIKYALDLDEHISLYGLSVMPINRPDAIRIVEALVGCLDNNDWNNILCKVLYAKPSLMGSNVPIPYFMKKCLLIWEYMKIPDMQQ